MKKQGIEIQEATTNDIDGILDVQATVWPILYSNKEEGISKEDVIESMQPKGDDVAKVWQRVISSHRDQNGESNTWVAKDGDKIVGFCYAVKEPNEGQIRSLYILPGYQNSEVGSILMNRMLDWFGNGANVVLESNKADKFFEKFGFKKSGKTSVQKLKSGKKIIEYKMKKEN